jgi:hypothetical protein
MVDTARRSGFPMIEQPSTSPAAVALGNQRLWAELEP